MPTRPKILSSVAFCFTTLVTLTFLREPTLAAETNLVKSKLGGHWSFQPLARPAVPQVTAKQWARNAIDNFVLTKLEENKLQPSREAGRVTLIRRLSFDVIGLPPTPEEIDQFVTDKSPNAYEKLVDRLLASPRYGERWARHWLDVVRFAESNGYETNLPRTNAWPYRDYVIRSFNEDKPYDKFVTDQLAGDQMGEDAATGFIVGGAWDAVKSPDVNLTMQQRMDELHDMVATTSSTFLGLTVGCARCHNHKFDPVSQVDYYAMQAMFAGVQHGERPLRLPDYAAHQEEAETLRRSLAALSRKLERFEPLAQVGETKQRRAPVHPLHNTERFAATEAKYVRFTVLKTSNIEPCIDELEIFTAEAKLRNVALAKSGAKASASGTFVGSARHKLEHINDGKYGNERSWISNEQGKGWVEIELPEKAIINRIIWARDREGKYSDRLPTEYRIEIATEADHWKLVASSEDRAPYKGGAALVRDYSAEGMDDGAAKDLAESLSQRKDLESRLKALTEVPQIYAGTFAQPGPTHKLFRGDPTQKREEVAPATLSEFGNKIELPANAPEAVRRVALAKWIVDPKNPLTARVMVNRIWQHHFGDGIVGTPSDFGHNGFKPTHPELLDWLASQFIERGWSIKAMHRLILTSSTYRQSSKANAQGMALDTSDRWLWRFPPMRLEAEPIRDAILAISGKLNLQMGGPGFDLFEPNDNYVKVYNSRNDFGPNEWRRMVYQAKPRMQLDDTFGAFDCPDAGQISPRRNSSTTPLQALNLLHGSFIIQQAGFFAERLKVDCGEDSKAQVRRAFRLTFGRDATKSEIASSAKFIKDTDLQNFCRALFNANEFLYVY